MEFGFMHASGNQTARRQCQPSSSHASHFQQVRKVSITVSKLGYTNLILIEPGAKINRQYHREVLPLQELLPVICSIALLEMCFVFQQDNAPTHHAHDMEELLSHA